VRAATQAVVIRPPAVPGSFYPQDPQELRALLSGCLADAVRRPSSHGVPQQPWRDCSRRPGDFRVLPIAAGEAGAPQVAAALECLLRRRPSGLRLLDLRNSGDTSAARTTGVEYGAFALYERG